MSIKNGIRKIVYGINIGIKKMLRDKVGNISDIEVSIDKKEWNNKVYNKKVDVNIDIEEVD